jgi:multidrug efflux pump subunit AcrB
MSRLLTGLVAQKRVVLTVALLLAGSGLVSWLTMAREEDPRFARRYGMVTAVFAGADARAIERLIVEPIEEQLAEIAEIKHVLSEARDNLAVVQVRLRDNVDDTTAAWDEVRRALRRARRDFPAGAPAPELDDDIMDTAAAVIVVRGPPDRIALADAAKRLERELLQVPGVARIQLVADPGEQIVVEYDDAVARRHGLDSRSLAAVLGGRSTIVPGGSIVVGSRNATLRPMTEFRDLKELAKTPILLPSGAALPLSALARVRRAPAEPARPRMRHDGAEALGLAVIQRPSIDAVAFGKRLEAALGRLRRENPALRLDTMSFQPRRVEQRLTDLQRSLLIGVGLLAAILILAMGLRLGLVVAAIVPLVALAALGFYALSGGILHQISIAALVIALGMLVDNAIVVAEEVQRRVDEGAARDQAAAAAIRQLALPLLTATATTLAAFVPMLMSSGDTADFTRALPVVIMLTLAVSYLFAIAVTPVLSALVLRPRPLSASPTRLARVADRLAGVALARPVRVLAAALALVLLAGLGATAVRGQFFPASDRDQLLVRLQLPVGTQQGQTARAVAKLEAALLGRDDVRSVSAFIGSSAPRFYYNVAQVPAAPHVAQLVVNTTDVAAVSRVLAWVRRRVRMTLPRVQVVASRLEQGPPILAPIELRLYAASLAKLRLASDAVAKRLRDIEGTADVRSSLGLGVPSLRLEIDDAAAARRRLSRRDVALALLGRTRGLVAGQYRGGEDPVSIVVRSSLGERLPAHRLDSIDVATPGSKAVPLAQLARPRLEWRPATIYHRDRRRLVSVLAQLAPGASYDRVMNAFLSDRPALPSGVTLALGGEAEGSKEANAALLRTLPLGALLLLLFLLIEFNSFRRLAIVLVTVPLAAAGVVPGLLAADQPFGFMSMLGVIALVGVVVNNAIVLLDLIESERRSGAELEQAVRTAVRLRTRPIVLTTVTTVCGLLPLAFSPTTLWPPMAWAMISGLLASTGLSLVVVPALYRLLFRAPQRPDRSTANIVPAAPLAPGAASQPQIG